MYVVPIFITQPARVSQLIKKSFQKARKTIHSKRTSVNMTYNRTVGVIVNTALDPDVIST